MVAKVMKGIFRIIDGSSLINKTIKNVESEFGIKILSKFNPYPSQANAQEVKEDDSLYPDLCLEVEGRYESMKKFSLATVDFN